MLDPIPICQPLCDSFFEECASILNGTDIGSFIPSCSQYPTTNCSNFDFIPPLGKLSFIILLLFLNKFKLNQILMQLFVLNH